MFSMSPKLNVVYVILSLIYSIVSHLLKPQVGLSTYYGTPYPWYSHSRPTKMPTINPMWNSSRNRRKLGGWAWHLLDLSHIPPWGQGDPPKGGGMGGWAWHSLDFSRIPPWGQGDPPQGRSEGERGEGGCGLMWWLTRMGWIRLTWPRAWTKIMEGWARPTA